MPHIHYIWRKVFQVSGDGISVLYEDRACADRLGWLPLRPHLFCWGGARNRIGCLESVGLKVGAGIRKTVDVLGREGVIGQTEGPDSGELVGAQIPGVGVVDFRVFND